MRDGEAIAELFRQVYAHPDDDHIRQVLSDALVLIGDPRGELIQLQLHPSADLERRAMQLIQRHGLTWLGGLRGAVVPLAYERGFLARCIVVTEDVASVAACDEWSTVHTIELSSGARAFVLHPAMRALRRLVGVSPNLLLDLANKYQPKLEQLTVEARYSPRFDDMLGRYLPASSIGTLTLVDVPQDRADRLRAFAARHTRMMLQLHVLPPPPVDDDDPFEDVDE